MKYTSGIKMRGILIFLCLLSVQLTAQTVKTDKPDYSPGEVAIISGEGWTADTQVRIIIDEEPAFDYGHQYYAEVADGKWQFLFPIEDRHLGVGFTVTVVGMQSNSTAVTQFTDGVNWSQGTSTATTCGSGTASFTINPTGSSTLIKWEYSTNQTTWTTVTNGGAYSGATTNSLSINTSLLAAGTHYYRPSVTTTSSNPTPVYPNPNFGTLTILSPITNNTISASQNICSGISPQTLVHSGVALTGGTGTYTYRWQQKEGAGSWEDINGSSGDDPTYSPAANLSQTTSYRRNVSSGTCTVSTSNEVTITINSVAAGTIGDDQNICLNGDPGEITSLTAGTGTAISYSWEFSTNSTNGTNGTWTPIANTDLASYDPAGPITEQTFFRRRTISTVGATICSAVTGGVKITVRQPPTTSVAGDAQTICISGSAVLNANSPTVGTGTWSVFNGPSILSSQFSSTTSNTATFTPAGGAGTYTLQWTIINTPECPPSISTVNIIVRDLPSTSLAGEDQTICVTGTATLAANNPAIGAGAWSVISGPSTANTQLSSTTVFNAVFTPAGGAGTYTLQWSISNSPCDPSTSTIDIIVEALPSTSVAGENQTICVTGAATLAANDPAIGAGAWSVISGPSTANTQLSSTTAFNAVFTPTGGPGTYTLQWSISNLPCDPSTSTVDIIVKALPSTSVAGENQTICVTGTATLAANDPAIGAGAWSVISGPSTANTQLSSTTAFNAVFTPTGGAGTYTLQWSISNSPCDPSTSTIDIIVEALPSTSVAGENQTICVTGSATLAANDPAIGTGAWSIISGPSTANAQLSSTTAFNAVFTPAGGAGTYTLQWSISNSPCDPSTSTVDIIVKALPSTSVAGENQTICVSGTATLAANNPAIGAGAWSVISGPSTANTQLSSTTVFNAVFTPAGGAGTYTLQWSISNSPCDPSTSTIDIIVEALPSTSVAGENQTICVTGSATLAANDPAIGTGAWSIINGPSTANAQLSSTTAFNAIFTPAGGAGTYTLQWSISNSPCDPSTSTVDIIVKDIPSDAVAGDIQTICALGFAELDANTPAIGTGAWSVVSGPSTLVSQFSSVSDPKATFTPASGVGTYTLRWTISNGPCDVKTDDLVITVITTPATPGTITGLSAVCEGSEAVIYSITAVLYATEYIWDVPANWIITEGQGTLQIKVNVPVGSVSGNISVSAKNDCGTSAARTKAVIVKLATKVTDHLVNTVPNTKSIEIVYGCQTPVLSVTAIGHGTLTYKWFRNTVNSTTGGTQVSLLSNSAYTIPAATAQGTYFYYAEVTGGCGTVKSEVFMVKIVPQIAEADGQSYYTGPAMAWTPTSSSNTATVTLTAVVKNSSLPDAVCGDIRTARVTFQTWNGTAWVNIPSAQNLPVNFVDPTNPSKGGAAAAIVQLSIGSNITQTFDLRVVISGNYRNNNNDGNEYGQANITISKLIPGGSISGGHLICNTKASGLLRPSVIVPSYLGFGVEYSIKSKQVQNPKGKVTLTVKSFYDLNGNLTPTLKWYKIVSNAIASLSITSPKATFSSKANVSLYDPITGISTPIEGNCVMVLDIEDKSTKTVNFLDLVGITVYKNAGGIWYSNNFEVSKTVPAAICGGDLTVTGVLNNNTRSIAVENTVSPDDLNNAIKGISVFPNPSTSNFSVVFEKGLTEKLAVSVIDVAGRIINEYNIDPASTFKFGSDLRPGVYMVMFKNSQTQKVIKIVKQ